VALCLPKSIRAVETIVAVLAVGAAYIPLNHRLPVTQLARILADLRPKLLIADAALAAPLRDAAPELRTAVLAESRAGIEISAPRYQLPSPDWQSPDDLAAVLYTSGSTGEPKGIMLSGGNLESFVDWAAETFAVTSADRLVSHAPFHFDLSIFDIFGALSRHASVHLIDETEVRFPGRIRQLIEANKLSIWYSVPTALAQLQQRRALQNLASLRLVMFAGEVFPVPVLRRLMDDLPRASYVNLYGPTETNVATYHKLAAPPSSDLDPIPIGIPCEHLDVIVCDPAGDEVAVGEMGEICVTGPSVMLGYWNRPSLTADTRLRGRTDSYRTGDHGWRRSDGALMFAGRRDQQVKLRGHRVELLALESALHAHPDVEDAAATVAGNATEDALAIFVVRRSGASLSYSDIRGYIAERLPPSYVPDRVEFLSAMPRTANGKCDRRALAAAARSTMDRASLS
jgi:amino acid adenylation domain-containing protein